jgi:integrase
VFNAILSKAPTAPIRLNPDLPAELERIINKAMEKDRKLRYQVALDGRVDLQRLKRDSDSDRSPVAVQVQMGHSDIRVTLNTYAHLFKETNPEAAAKTDELVFGATWTSC